MVEENTNVQGLLKKLLSNACEKCRLDRFQYKMNNKALPPSDPFFKDAATREAMVILQETCLSNIEKYICGRTELERDSAKGLLEVFHRNERDYIVGNDCMDCIGTLPAPTLSEVEKEYSRLKREIPEMIKHTNEAIKNERNN